MEPIDVNGSVHTARKQHQRKNVPICARVASRVLCGLGHKKTDLLSSLSHMQALKDLGFKAKNAFVSQQLSVCVNLCDVVFSFFLSVFLHSLFK